MRNVLTILGLGNLQFSASLASILALLLHGSLQFLAPEHALVYQSLLFATVLGLSLVAANREKEYASADHKEIVVDEFLGMQLCLLIAGAGIIPYEIGWTHYVTLLFIFRVLDIFKPFPFNWVEKKLSGTYGFLWDDLIIGLVIGVIVKIVQYWLLVDLLKKIFD